MKKKTIFILLILAVTVLISFIFIPKKNDYIFIGNDDYYFGMSKSYLKNKSGKPDTIDNDCYDASIDEYIYQTEIDDHKATYIFHFIKSRLIYMSVTVNDIDYDTALAITEKCIDKQKDFYSDRKGFYLSEINTTDNGNFSVSDGVNYGATGISFDYEYLYNTLTMDAVIQK